MIKLQSPKLEELGNQFRRLLLEYERLHCGKVRERSRAYVGAYKIKDFFFGEHVGVGVYVKRGLFYRPILKYREKATPPVKCDLNQVGHLQFALKDLKAKVEEAKARNDDREAVLEEVLSKY